MRILVTGSRDWTDVHAVRQALFDVWMEWDRPSDAVLVHGACHLGGADMIADACWRQQGFPVESYPAERDGSGRLLGPERNQMMVDLGADICLAFPLADSRGTWSCVRRAKRAGIPVRVISPT